VLPVHEQVPLERIYDARARLGDEVLRTPLVHLEAEDGGIDIYLKLENLQPIGSFKLRGALNALGLADRDQLAAGVWTASAGNMGQGVAWVARRMGLPCTVVVPDGAPATKTEALARLGATVVGVPFAQWLEVFRTRRHGGLEGVFVHPFSDSAVMAGNGTIALEILDDLPDVDAVIVQRGARARTAEPMPQQKPPPP
jgi:threonine dehydratase